MGRCVAVLIVTLALTGCGQTHERVPSPDRARAQKLVAGAAAGDAAAVDRALAAGAHVDERARDGRTAVTAAAMAEHVEVVALLVEAGADVDLQDDDGHNALLVCGETGNVDVLRAVLRADPDLTRLNQFGGTALIPASDRGHVEVVRELLRTDIAIDHINRFGWTALLEAVILGDGGNPHRQIVRMLIDAGADVNLADRDGATPLEHARTRGWRPLAEALAAAGAR